MHQHGRVGFEFDLDVEFVVQRGFERQITEQEARDPMRIHGRGEGYFLLGRTARLKYKTLFWAHNSIKEYMYK